MKRLLFPLLILLLGGLLGCSGGEETVNIPSDVIPPDSMVNILVDFHLTEGILLDLQQNNKQPERNAVVYYEMLYKKHHIDRERFDRTQEFYSHHPKLYLKIYDDVLAELSRQESEALK